MGGLGNNFERFFEFRLARNHACHSGPSISEVPNTGPDCQLAIVEFDDQGLCFDRRQLAEVQAVLGALHGANPIIVTFVHGWKHNARSDDTNLGEFKTLLAATRSRLRAAGSQRPILGVYASWRGLSTDGNWIWEQCSFWGRQQAAHRVAHGSPRELLGMLKAFRNGPPGSTPHATLVIVGHSFGGLIVYSAIAQSLIESASDPARVVPSFGDLVLLVNPAFSAVSYLPIHQIAKARAFDVEQPPVFVSVTATNDDATKILYPAGNFLRRWTEDVRGREEHDALTRTMGHLPWMRTHELSVATAPNAPSRDAPLAPAVEHEAMASLTTPGTSQIFDGVQVTRMTDSRPGPFWVASAPPAIIDGHNGIFKNAFTGFVYALLAAHVAKPGERRSGQTTAPAEKLHALTS